MVPWDTWGLIQRPTVHSHSQRFCMLRCRRPLQVLNNCVHTCVGACVATPVTSLCTLVNMCVHVVVVATYVCVFCLCVLTCLCVFKGVQSYICIRTGAFVLMCVQCVHLCIPVHVHVGSVLQCYKKTVMCVSPALRCDRASAR